MRVSATKKMIFFCVVAGEDVLDIERDGVDGEDPQGLGDAEPIVTILCEDVIAARWCAWEWSVQSSRWQSEHLAVAWSASCSAQRSQGTLWDGSCRARASRRFVARKFEGSSSTPC